MIVLRGLGLRRDRGAGAHCRRLRLVDRFVGVAFVIFWCRLVVCVFEVLCGGVGAGFRGILWFGVCKGAMVAMGVTVEEILVVIR